MQLQSVPGGPWPPVDSAAARLAAQGIVVVSGALTEQEAAHVAAVVVARGDAAPTIHLMNVKGSVAAALWLHDLVGDAHVVGAGTLETAGAVVLAGGGLRRLLPSARIHLTPVEEPATEALDVERAAAEVLRLRREAQEILGLDLSRSRVLEPHEAVAAGLADEVC